LVDVETRIEDEVVERGGPEFVEGAALWAEVIEKLGRQIVTARFCTEFELEEARESYQAWLNAALLKQTLSMRAVTGIVR
jgi:hypothetical protein